MFSEMKAFPPGNTSPLQKQKVASSGNRTRAARVAGEHSTTEPTMLLMFEGDHKLGVELVI